MDTKNEKIILFDGECNLCNGFINYIIDRDDQEVYKFAPLQSSVGIQLLKKADAYSSEIDSIILIDTKTQKMWRKSRAAINIIGSMGGYWSFIRLFRVLPTFINDVVYDYVARNRYKWFGKSSCRIPTPELTKKFLS